MSVFAGNLVGWLGEVLAGLLLFAVLALIARVLVELFYGRSSAIVWSLRAMTEPMAAPFRRLLGGLRRRLPFDLAPVLAAVVLYFLQHLVFVATQMVAYRLAGPQVQESLATAVIRRLLFVYIFVVLVRVLVTWFGSPAYHPFVRLLARLTDPALRFVRGLLPRSWAPWAPFVLLAALWFLDRVVLETVDALTARPLLVPWS